jgi:hypothetical protein
MAARSTMANLISRVRILINDSAPNQTFSDNIIQDCLDEGRVDVLNYPLKGVPTFVNATISYLDYFSEVGGGWEEDYVFKQYLTIPVIPASFEPIVGRFHFATSLLPTVYISGKLYDCYRAAADLLERQAAKWSLSYDFSSDGASFHRGQATSNLLTLAKQYRMKQRAVSISVNRSDINSGGANINPLAPTSLDYMSSGNGNG